MIPWICGVNTQEHTGTAVLYSKLGIAHLDINLRRNMLHWFGHTYRSHSWIKKCQTLEVVGTRGRGRLERHGWTKSWRTFISATLWLTRPVTGMIGDSASGLPPDSPLARGRKDSKTHDDGDGDDDDADDDDIPSMWKVTLVCFT